MCALTVRMDIIGTKTLTDADLVTLLQVLSTAQCALEITDVSNARTAGSPISDKQDVNRKSRTA